MNLTEWHKRSYGMSMSEFAEKLGLAEDDFIKEVRVDGLNIVIITESVTGLVKQK